MGAGRLRSPLLDRRGGFGGKAAATAASRCRATARPRGLGLGTAGEDLEFGRDVRGTPGPFHRRAWSRSVACQREPTRPCAIPSAGEMIRLLRVVAVVAAATARPSAGGVDLDLDRAGVASRALRRLEPECPRPCLERHDSRIRSDLEGAQPLCVVDRYGVAVDDRAAV